MKLLLLSLLSASLLASSASPALAITAQENGNDDQDQDQGSSLQEQIRRRNRERLGSVPEVRREDGSVILPGEIPASASAPAKAAWRELIDSLRSPTPMQAFRLAFAMRHRSPEKKQSNDLNLDFSFLSPGFVRSKLESGRTLLRGPRGDYLIDKEEVIKLLAREGAEDKKQLDQMAAIASNFVSLTHPVSMRLADLKLLDEAPKSLHPRHRGTALRLTWIEVTSPDFFLYTGVQDAPTKVPLYRARLGIDAKTQAVHMAIIERENDPGGAAFVHLASHRERSKLLVPHVIDVYSLDPQTLPPRFKPTPDTQLSLDPKRGQLRAMLTPEDFLPPVK